MNVQIGNRAIPTDEQGFLSNMDDWSEEFVEQMAGMDGITLYDDHWGLISYFRDYFEQTHSIPSMHKVVLVLGRQHGPHFHDRKAYERYVYSLFPRDPYREICKLAGLPRPEADT